MSNARPVEVMPPSFEAQARPVLTDLRDALARLVEALPTPVRRAVDLERALRLDKKLAWQVFRLSRSDDLTQAANVPSLTSAGRLIEAARKRGVRDRTLAAVREAFERFEDFATTHAGDRAGLVSMISTLEGGVDEQFELNVRRTIFRAQSHVWGVHARLAVRTAIFVAHPGPTAPGIVRNDDMANVSEDIDMVRRREGDPLVLERWFDTKRDRDQREAGAAAGSASSQESELLTQFSSNPLPQMTSRRPGKNVAETELVFPPGRAGAVTMYWRELQRDVLSTPDENAYACGTFITMPMEALVREIYVPVGWSDPATARASVYARRHHPERVFEERRADLLPQRETLEYLGAFESPPEVRDAPHHAAAIRYVLERHGWQGRRFDVYRCRVQYPLMYSLVMARVDASRQPPVA